MILISLAIASLFVTVLVNIVMIAIRNHKAQQFFKLKVPHVPTVPDANLFIGHLGQTVWQTQQNEFLDNLYKRLGPFFGVYYCDKPILCTADIKFIKQVVLDEPHPSINRNFKLNIGIDELEFDNLMSAENNQWRRIRKAIAPALS